MNLETTLPQREVRRSFALNVFNGAAFEFAERLIDPPLVLTWFVGQLTSSNLLIGLVSPLGDAGWFLPQIFVSTRVQRLERKMPAYITSAIVRTLAWMLLAAAVWLVDDPHLLLASFFVCYTIARTSAGLAGLSFFDVTAKTIPAQRRGSLFAWRQFLGGLVGLGASLVVKQVLNSPALPFPHGHAVLFALYCAVVVPAMAAFIAIREPPGPVVKEAVTLRQQFRRAGALLRQDGVFRRFMAARLILSLATIALPFYGVYARNVLGAPAGIVGLYIAVRVAAQILSNLPWGWLSDRRGNRLAMKLQCIGNGVTALLALALVVGVAWLRPQGPWLPYLVLPLFFLDGAMRPVGALTGSNFLLELVPTDERSLYLGLSNTMMGVTVLLSGLGGLVVDAAGFGGLFGLACVLYAAAYMLTTGLPEPRVMGKART
jgi:MFS family permease